MSEDIKELLSKAFGQEPPLGIDREEVLQQGRKRLRRRRFAEAGSVVAVVVVVAVGAAMLTNLTGGKDSMPPAASTSQHAPPGPDLPVPDSSTTVRPPVQATTTTHLPISPDTPVAEEQLTALLYSSGVFNEKQVSTVPNQIGPPRFTRRADQYLYEADLHRKTSSGFVQVTIDLNVNMVVDCREPQVSAEDCVIKNPTGTPIALTHSHSADGERSTRAVTTNRGGIRVTASATNLTRHDKDLNRDSDGGAPVLTDDELCILVTKAVMIG